MKDGGGSALSLGQTVPQARGAPDAHEGQALHEAAAIRPGERLVSNEVHGWS